MALTLKNGVPVRGREIIAEQPDGGRKWLSPYPTPLVDGDGTLMGAVNVLVDITELKLAQSALEQALVAKDDFLGMISHELRNPVLQVAGNARLLRDGWSHLPEDTREAMVEDLHTAGSRIQRLVENMLVLSRFERGMLPDAEPHLLQRILVDTLDEFRRRFPRTVLHVDIPPDLPPILTSPNTVDQVCWNLLTNAHKHGPPEGPIEVVAVARGGKVEIEVRDRGPGVPEDELDNLFQPYYRASNTQVHAGGLGLGLSVCRRLVEAHGGEMWARRREPHGMEFGMRFHVAEAVTVE
jgi:signal transduction histidine kinase